MTPDYLFEVSWEVCNKVGGIHTVVATKAKSALRKFGDHYVLIGPDLQHEGTNPEFEEDATLLRAWRQSVYEMGIRIRVGRWKIQGEPMAILIDFTSLFPKKDDILKHVNKNEFDVLVTLGAGDIENYAQDITNMLSL